jgi:hypothetical protein
MLNDKSEESKKFLDFVKRHGNNSQIKNINILS